MRRLFVLPFFLLLLLISPAQAATVNLLTPSLQPGQTVIAAFDQLPTRVALNGKVLTPFPYRAGWRALAPVALTTKEGSQQLIAEFGDTSVTKDVTILPRKSKIIVLPVPPKLNQTGTQLVKNLATTNTSINQSVQTVADTTRFSAPFGLPLANNRRLSSLFGEVRKTGTEVITHLGTDFVMPKGSAVAAINDGVVTKAYLDPVYGNSVFIDHGRGIYSLYLHLNSMRVKAGAAVKKGTIIGTLGETGLASGPHLHLSIKINGVSVDPLQFIGSFK